MLAPYLLCDKSALQSLSRDEVNTLHSCFQLIVPPVLALEIIGDLKKQSSLNAEQMTKTLALKINGATSVFQEDSSSLLLRSLMGEEVPFKGVPIVGNARRFENTSGEVGEILELSEHEKAIAFWKEGKFSDADEALSESWRQMNREISFDDVKKDMRKHISPNHRPADLREARRIILEVLTNRRVSRDILEFLLLHVPSEYAHYIFSRYEQRKAEMLNTFTPYGSYVLEVYWTFFLALDADLVGTRPTNWIDLQYLLYQPFSILFATNDKFQLRMAEAFKRDDEEVVTGQKLKSELRKEIDSKSIWIDKVWNKGGYGARDNRADGEIELTEQSAASILEYLRAQQVEADSGNRTLSGVAEFTIQHKRVAPTDTCMCGSGKLFKNCHGRNLPI